MKESIEDRIEAFKLRTDTDREYCLYLFEYASIRLLAAKYAYYICCNNFITDNAYDLEEKSWFVMGRALNLLNDEETSICIDFDAEHYLAPKAIELAKKLMKK